DPLLDRCSQLIEKPDRRQHRDRKKQGKKKEVLPVFVRRLMEGQPSDPAVNPDPDGSDGKPGKRRDEERHVVVSRMPEEERDKRDEGELAPGLGGMALQTGRLQFALDDLRFNHLLL